MRYFLSGTNYDGSGIAQARQGKMGSWGSRSCARSNKTKIAGKNVPTPFPIWQETDLPGNANHPNLILLGDVRETELKKIFPACYKVYHFAQRLLSPFGEPFIMSRQENSRTLGERICDGLCGRALLSATNRTNDPITDVPSIFVLH